MFTITLTVSGKGKAHQLKFLMSVMLKMILLMKYTKKMYKKRYKTQLYVDFLNGKILHKISIDGVLTY